MKQYVGEYIIGGIATMGLLCHPPTLGRTAPRRWVRVGILSPCIASSPRRHSQSPEYITSPPGASRRWASQRPPPWASDLASHRTRPGCVAVGSKATPKLWTSKLWTSKLWIPTLWTGTLWTAKPWTPKLWTATLWRPNRSSGHQNMEPAQQKIVPAHQNLVPVQQKIMPAQQN